MNVLTVLFEGQSHVEDLDLGVVVVSRVVPIVFWKDGGVRGWVDDSVPVRIFAGFGLNALVPEPFVSIIHKFSIYYALQ